jgi:hypothetical protein
MGQRKRFAYGVLVRKAPHMSAAAVAVPMESPKRQAPLAIKAKFVQFVDRHTLPLLKTNSQRAVLRYIVANTIWWTDRSGAVKTTDRISRRQFVNGKQRRDGTWLDHGACVSRSAARDALHGRPERHQVGRSQPRVPGTAEHGYCTVSSPSLEW